jgi:hypothetical protein
VHAASRKKRTDDCKDGNEPVKFIHRNSPLDKVDQNPTAYILGKVQGVLVSLSDTTVTQFMEATVGRGIVWRMA